MTDDAPCDRYQGIRSFCADVTRLLTTHPRSSDTVHTVKRLLSDLISLAPQLPEAVRHPSTDDYARHLLYRDPGGLFEMVVMAWGPGQATPVHDHAGLWCVEGVVQGTIEVTRYDLCEATDAGTVRMEPMDVIRAGLGECGALIPPVEYHRISNPFEQVALTIHVYGGLMTQCRVFEPTGAGDWVVRSRPLQYVNPLPALPQ